MDSELLLMKHARISQIAKLAGVGTATVDRVLNNRAHVSPSTRQRVLQAKSAIESGAKTITRAQPWRLKILLPEEAGPSTEYLAACFQDVGSKGNAIIECVFSKKLEPAALSRKLRACAGQGIDAIAFQALEDPRVRDAVEELYQMNIPSLALISGIETPSLVSTVCMDNRAAGRTAGYLLGRLARQAGPVAVITGGELYRSHEDREMGFRASLRRNFPHLEVITTTNGHDDIERNYQTFQELLQGNPDLVGVYNVGGGNEGIIKALREVGLLKEIISIGHNLTPKTQDYLLDGSMDIILHQDMRLAAGYTVDILIAHLENRPFQSAILPVQVITKENIVGTTFG